VSTVATGINKSGKIVLYWTDSGSVLHSALYDGKTYKSIDVPGATGSASLDLDAAGDVVFQWFDSTGAFHGALLHGGKYYKFDYPKAVNTYGGGINDKHTIAGGYQAVSKGSFAGFTATFK